MVATALARSGTEVVGIARGAQLAAIRKGGLTLRAPGGTVSARFECVSDPGELALRPDDCVLLAMKSQDTRPALDALSGAGLREQPLFCLQNGVANERAAGELFANVHGVTVMMPANYIRPGRVAAFTEPRLGIFELGRREGGTDAADAALARQLEAANIAAFVTQDVMAGKYGKLLVNLTNILQAASGPKADHGDLPERIRAEAEAVYRAAGIVWRDVGMDDPRRAELARFRRPRFTRYVGSSTTQSLLRGTGSIETDYFNGEIAALARRFDAPAPLNTRLALLGTDLARRGARPGAMTPAEIEAFLARA